MVQPCTTEVKLGPSPPRSAARVRRDPPRPPSRFGASMAGMRSFRSLLPAAVALVSGFAIAGDARAGLGDLLGTKPGDLANPGFLDADGCTTCHGNGFMNDKTYLPSDSWGGTMMANAARDPVFFAGLAVANQDVPGVGTYCLRCHSPIGYVRGHATPSDGSAFDAIDQQGIGCETCHRARASNLSADPYVVSDAQLFYDGNELKDGPYPPCDATGMPVGCSSSPAHDVEQSTTIDTPTFCGQCHQVTNPDRMMRDATGTPTSFEFPLDTTYEEWKSSAYATGGASPKTCQDCHMPEKAGMWPVSNVFQSPKRMNPDAHSFVGGNHWGIQAVMAANPDRAALLPTPFQNALDATLANLKTSVVVTIESAPTTGSAGQTVDVKVKVENKTGHKFPTGYAESRRAWIGIALVDDAKNESMLLGGYDDATGEIASAPATHVYRAEHGSWDGMKGVVESHLALHDMILSDTRIPPTGFVAGPTTTPLGDVDFSDGAGGYKSFDEATFTVTIPAGAVGKQHLEARVYYQSMTREYVDFLASANTTNTKGTDLRAIYDSTGKAPPISIATATSDIDLGGSATTSSTGGSGGQGAGGGGAGGAGGGGASGDSGCGCSLGGEDGGAATAAALSIVVAGLSAMRIGRRRPKSERAR